MRTTIFALIALTMLGALAMPAIAQDDEVRLDLDFKAESLNQVLQMFRRGYGLEYTLGEGVDPDMQITTHLRGVTLDQALQSIMGPNGLIAIEQNGRYVIKERPEPTEREVQTRDVTPIYAAEGRTPPQPTRQVRDYEPRRGEAQEDEDGDEEEERDEVMDIIWPMHLGADMAAMLFGGDFIEAGGYFGGGSGGYGGSSSYGSSRGSSGFGGSSRSSSFGSSNRSSSFGSSNRSSSFGSNY